MTLFLLMLGANLIILAAGITGAYYFLEYAFRDELAQNVREKQEIAREREELAEAVRFFDELTARYRAETLRLDTAYVRNTLDHLYKACTPAEPEKPRTWLRVVDGGAREGVR